MTAIRDTMLDADPRRRPGHAGPPRSAPLATIRDRAGSAAFDPEPTAAERPLGRLGSLEVRLAATADEIRLAQALRYRVFFEEGPACPDERMRRTRRDADPFDFACDHLLVVDRARRSPGPHPRPEVVATCRLIDAEAAARMGGFYSSGEFDLAPLLARQRGLRFLEVGRSCILASYRGRRTAELLWHGIWAHALRQGADAMIGCASLSGVDANRLALPLSFLHHRARVSGEWWVEALPERRVEMNLMPAEAVQAQARAAVRALPALVKGYLRLGACFADGAVIDAQFDATDVLVVLPVAAIDPRYVKHYGVEAQRYACRS